MIVGGDESLVAELKRNRDAAVANPASVQGFMRSSGGVTTEREAESLITLDERRQNVRRLTMDNDAQELALLEQYKQYALANITDPRIKERIQNDIVNRLVSSLEQHTSNGEGTVAAPQQSFFTIDEVATTHMGLRLSTSVKSKIGQAAARRFAQNHPDLDFERVEKYTNGEMRQIRAYPAVFLDTLKQLITEHTTI